MASLNKLKKEISLLADKKQAENLQRFFKTKKGEYGEGDIFLGIKVPVQRNVSKSFLDLDLVDIQALLNSKIHEERMIALFILLEQYKKAGKEKNESIKKQIFDFYLKNTKNINNWDLVDLSCRDIVGNYLLDKDRKILYRLAKSNHLWERRIAIISTSEFIRYNKLEDTFKISELLLCDKHDLIQKAVGWMLREAGKRNKKAEIKFLLKHKNKMPRIMLRYSIEKFSDKERQSFMR